MGILTQAIGLILSLSILVILHEAGHFAFAKLFKTRVEKFYLFFNPWFSLFKYKKGETEYGIGWLPLGGYVKISGMIDESMDKEQLSKPPEPYEFRAKPAWQRLLIMVGGVLVNFIVGYFLYAMILFVWGQEYIPAENAKYGVVCDSLALDLGMQNGDKILNVDGKKLDRLADFSKFILVDDAKVIQVERDGRLVDINIPPSFKDTMLAHQAFHLVDLRFPFVAREIMNGSGAEAAGIQKNDEIIGINDTKTPSFHEFAMTVSKYKGQEVNVMVKRYDQEIALKTKVSDAGKIGVAPVLPSEFLDVKKIEYTFWEAIPAGIALSTNTLVTYVKQLKLLFSAEGAKQIGGFGAIGSLFSKTWHWASFWQTTALLSLILAFMNILPIPALDGGHVMFVLYEMITRRKPSEKFLEYAQIVGMVLLFSLLIFANGNDIVRHFFN